MSVLIVALEKSLERGARDMCTAMDCRHDCKFLQLSQTYISPRHVED